MDIPKVSVHKEYISCLKQLYLENFKAIKEKVPKDNLVPEEKNLSLHFAKEFRNLKEIVNEDYFEWNHAIFCAIVYFSYQEQMTYEVDDSFLTRYSILPIQDTLADLILLMHHIDQKWASIDLSDSLKFKTYIKAVHAKVAKYIGYADNIAKFNRWNLIKFLKTGYFSLSTDGLMYITCRAAYHLRYLHFGSLMSKHLHDPVEVLDSDVDKLRRWCEEQETYFSIRKFRMRMIGILWTFFNDEPSRCFYTYTRSGEVPTVLAHVTQTFPSAWISSIQHEMLYDKAKELIHHANLLIQDAVLIALFEAHFKTHYNIAWSRYCMCMEEDILNTYSKLLTVEHPMILKIWAKFYVFWNGKLFLTTRFEKAIVLWFKLVKEHCNGCLFRNINLTNTINRVLPPETPPELKRSDVFEVYL